LASASFKTTNIKDETSYILYSENPGQDSSPPSADSERRGNTNQVNDVAQMMRSVIPFTYHPALVSGTFFYRFRVRHGMTALIEE
jgi:hypothetical protein